MFLFKYITYFIFQGLQIFFIIQNVYQVIGHLVKYMIDGRTRHILDTFIHYMKGGETFEEIFENITKDTNEWCPFNHGDFVDDKCYNSYQSIENLIFLLEKYILCNRFLSVNQYIVDDLKNDVNKLKNSQLMKTKDQFDEIIDDIKELTSILEDDIRKKLNRLTCEECTRLDEALVTHSNYCFYSSVIMAVSAVEFRLHYMVKNTDEDLYFEQFEKATLGQLIQIFNKNEYNEDKYDNIKKLMPKRHLPLVQLLNQYRIVSAHPKEVEVSPQIAESILNLSFAFLTDPETCLYDDDYLKCDT